MNRKILLPLMVLSGAIIIAALMMLNKPRLEPQKTEPIYTTVTVRQVQPQAVQLSVTTQGTVAPRNQSTLVPEVSGRVVWMSPALVSGGQFTEGQILLRIDEGDYQTAVARAESAVVKAKAELGAADSEYQRVQKLFKQQLASQSQFDQAKRVYQVAEAGLNEAQLNLQQARRDLTRTKMQAPFSGRVRSETVDLGQFISRGEIIAKIYADDYVEIRVPIANTQFAYLNLDTFSSGQLAADKAPPAEVRARYANQSFQWQGTLVRMEAEVDSASRMFYGVVRVKNDVSETQPPLAVGLFVTVEIKGRYVENIVTLPRAAVRDNNRVLVLDKENRLHFRDVRLLRLQHEQVLISEGLSDGEWVCISPLQVVVDGMRVNPLKFASDAVLEETNPQ